MMALFGIILVALGLFLMVGGKLPLLGKLPGDISLKRGDVHIVIPLTTSILLSLLASGVLWLLSLFTKK